jgi:hypothetical protein
MNLRLVSELACVAATAVLLAGCAPPPPQNFNDPAFARRAPSPGQPTYLSTIKYIDDGIRYSEPAGAFFVSPDGRMCFRGVLNVKQTIFDDLYQSDWCLAPTAIGRVETVPSVVTGTSDLQLSCNHANPQCAREIRYSDRAANTVIVPTVASHEEKVAVERLIYLMGGYLDSGPPIK